ncbi:MAG: outer membrane protein [Erythrobacter sp.]|uniref:outer membrane protein n=1 Tax=Erythrobacter sp. HL-111 TaxID=1798193 RepID=UPI0006DAC957|nr:outer membrane beta-barrel protein [Erythrobacter sp. HL-111]KPP94980.1 MAG: outer membrane immunogenic protein [Erythrobacteraceae bacterium HL-111]SDS13663.1 outer membrane immunogenic protein [Erythrobacter sp. HL-111]
MKKLTLFLLAGSAFAVSSPAMAQEEDDFTGFRLEALAGFDASKAGDTVDDDLNEDNDESIEGLVYGVGAGYDYDFGGIVVGVEAELTDSTADTGFDDGNFEDIGLGQVDTGRDIYLGARAGVVASPGLLVYAKGGYTNARYNREGTFDGEDYAEKIDADGYRLGAGAEYRFATNTFAKLEYRYSNYSEAELDFEDDTIPDVDLGGIDLDRHQVMAGVGLRF